jgi:hypothetical protein
MALALVNADNPTEAVPLENRDDAASTAAELGWRENAYLVVEHEDEEFLNRLTRTLARAEEDGGEGETTTENELDKVVTKARLVTEDGHIYEVAFTEDGRQLRVAGRGDSVQIDRETLDHGA